VFLNSWSASAQTDKTFELEAGGNYRHLTDGYSPWLGAYLRVLAKPGNRNNLYFEVLRQREFDDTGTYFSFAGDHTINQDWYVFGAVGGSSGGFFFPSLRADAQVNKKWLSKRQLVTTIGAGYFDAKDEHRDSSLFLGGIYYFETPWVLQGGVRWNRSMPGAVISQSQFVALTQGQEGIRYIAIRVDAGREAYQAIGPGEVLVDFPSGAVTLAWKQWLGPDWGFNAVTEYYLSRVYQRTGISFGIFKSF
jgi:YaiO family outer membrane protein